MKFILLLAFIPSLAIAKCFFKVDEYCQVLIENLKVTQSDIGPWNVERKTKKLKSFETHEKLNRYLIKKAAPVVIGPQKELYFIDGHHTLYALSKLKIKEHFKKAYIKILFDASKMNPSDFWKMMINKNWVYPKSKGKKINIPKDLPANIYELGSDHYRGLISFMNQDEKCFKKTNTPFQEFFWADHFRKFYTDLKDSSLKELKKAAKKLKKYCSHPKSKNLPGFKRIKIVPSS